MTHSKKLKLACITVAVAQVLNAANANAAIIEVDTVIDTSGANSATCTLRDAIIAANTDSLVTGSACVAGDGSDVIEFSGLANPSTITLSAQLPLITSTITINGPDRDSLAISGADSYVMFRNDAELTLSNLTLRDGFYDRERAAAIESYGESLVLESLNIIDNGTTNGQPNGSIGIIIISDDNDKFVLNNSLVSNNSSRVATIESSYGTSEATISNSTFTHNIASRIISLTTSVANIYNTHVTDNTGTGIRIGGRDGTIKDSVISNNTRKGVSISSGPQNIIDSTISNNSNGLTSYSFPVFISGSTISGNSPFGGIYFLDMVSHYNSNSVSISNSTISNNSSTLGGNYFNGGGASLAVPNISIKNSTFTGNETNGDGGGLFLGGGSGNVVITNSIFSGNSATLGTEIASSSPAGPLVQHVSANNVFGSDMVETTSALSNFIPTSKDILATSDELGLAISEIILDLDDNGGGTLTHALVPNSPAIDRGFGCEPVDQRGEKRGALCDIGAFEFNINDQSEIDFYVIPLEDKKSLIIGL